MFEITINHDFRPNDYRVYKGKIVIPPYIMAQREELAVKAKAKMSRFGQKPTDRPCKLSIWICRHQDPMKDFFGDGDNHCKWIADSLTGIVYENDAQIQEYHIYKMKTAWPCLKVRVEPFDFVGVP